MVSCKVENRGLRIVFNAQRSDAGRLVAVGEPIKEEWVAWLVAGRGLCAVGSVWVIGLGWVFGSLVAAVGLGRED